MKLGPQRSASYEGFADTIDQITLEAAPEDLGEMFGRVALTLLVGNANDHWRNHGFLHVDGAWRPSPLFDVNPPRVNSRMRSRRIKDRADTSNRDVSLLIEGRGRLPPHDVRRRERARPRYQRGQHLARNSAEAHHQGC